MSTALTENPELLIPDDGGDTNVWALIYNALHAAFDRHLGGVFEAVVASGNVELTTENAQNARIEISGNTASTRTVFFPARNRTFIVSNASTGNDGVLLCLVGFGVNAIKIPPATSMVVRTDTVTDHVIAVAPPVGGRGFFPATITHLGADHAGPGIAFGGGLVGFANPGVGLLSVRLTDVANALFRFQAANSEDLPLLGMGEAYSSGLRVEEALTTGPTADRHPEQLVFTTVAGDRMILNANGLAMAGAAAPGPGAGKINALQYYRSGVAMPFQKTVSRTNLPVGANLGSGANHNQGTAPTQVFGLLKCTGGADAGYATGDTVSGPFSLDGAVIAYGGNATQLFYRQNNQTLALPNKTTGSMTELDTAKWRLELLGCWP